MCFPDEFVCGWQAAERGDRFEPDASEEWKAGYRLWESQQECREAWSEMSASSVALH